MPMKIEMRAAWWTSQGQVTASAKQARIAELTPHLWTFNEHSKYGERLSIGGALAIVFERDFERLEKLVHEFRSMIDASREVEDATQEA